MGLISKVIKDLMTHHDGVTYSYGRVSAAGLGFVGLGVVITPVIDLLWKGIATASDWAQLLNAEALMFPTVAAGVATLVYGTLKSEAPTTPPSPGDSPDII